MVNKIKLDYKIEFILGGIAGLYFIIIAGHYFNLQNKIEKKELKESMLNKELFLLQEKNNTQNNDLENNDYNNKQISSLNQVNINKEITQKNYNFILLLDALFTKKISHISYSRILKKNNIVFINLQVLNKNNNIKEYNLLKNLKTIFLNFDYVVNKIRIIDNTTKVYLSIKL